MEDQTLNILHSPFTLYAPQNFALALFLITAGTYSRSKGGGANKVCYGQCGNDEFAKFIYCMLTLFRPGGGDFGGPTKL